MKCSPIIACLAMAPILCSAQDHGPQGVDDTYEAHAPKAPDYALMRRELLKEIERDVRATAHQTGRVELRADVMAAMNAVPRHEFVPPEWHDSSYQNRPLPIGEGQTISQPYIVALMTELLDPEPDSVILDIGTGSGYQAAVLAELVSKVYSLEILPRLAETAAERLSRLGYLNVEVRVGNGWQGWPEHAPYDGIIVAAAASELPSKLVQQLKPGAKMILPLKAGPFAEQLTVVEKLGDGSIQQRAVLPVRFVPMVGEH